MIYFRGRILEVNLSCEICFKQLYCIFRYYIFYGTGILFESFFAAKLNLLYWHWYADIIVKLCRIGMKMLFIKKHLFLNKKFQVRVLTFVCKWIFRDLIKYRTVYKEYEMYKSKSFKIRNNFTKRGSFQLN